jgi:hypothetical protein
MRLASRGGGLPDFRAISARPAAHKMRIRQRMTMPVRRSARNSRPRSPCRQRARRQRSRPSAVFGPVDLPP